ncbi:hypothetical protein PsYK624_068810 [Phanerochaete sordida]|uniref:Uncharacterized protein n=1 Tax=Phanerochaete sordida TaxID=48140 RepID=A0A9P3G9X2_9APHY|nr:hypothetical protein PsYK624_068810 [Phanerochaete sordida]
MPSRLPPSATSPAQGTTNVTETNNAAADTLNSAPPARPPPPHPLPPTPPIDIPHGRRSARNYDPAFAASTAGQTFSSHSVGGTGGTYTGAVFPMTFSQPAPPSTPVVARNPPPVPVQQRMVNGVGATHAPTLDSIPSVPVTPQSSPTQGHAGSSFPTPIRSGWSYDATTGRIPQAAATAPSVLPPVQSPRREQGSGTANATGSATRTEGDASERIGSRQ